MMRLDIVEGGETGPPNLLSGPEFVFMSPWDPEVTVAVSSAAADYNKIKTMGVFSN
jgi:hypothetical protein